ncbi:MAG: transcriptional regulator MarR family [Pseudonocardiales bacterium]|nr:transcriptional regulator MarR family [Jatrophihabitantaceae bacterium]MCW2602962.1 transcriptional regulator MarR family [Pseudonocardiales bacterium]
MAENDDPSLSEAFWAVARQLRSHSREALSPWEINPSHLRALQVLARHDAVRLRDLADHLRIAPRSATEVVDGLESRGLVLRRPDPADRRAILVELTDEGQRVLAAIRGARDTEAEALFGRLSAADRAQLARILGTLRD